MKHFIFSGLISLGALAFLAGCGDEIKTTEYYKQHIEEAKEKDAKCQKQGNLNENQQKDCSNARQAILSMQDNRSPWGNGKQHDNEAFKWK
ncbi:EexN family lipoprotein [Campylobacter jejuni]|nr:EexN family lipoprotein [Campylobacter lari]